MLFLLALMRRRKFFGRTYFAANKSMTLSKRLDKFKESLERTNESTQDLFEKQLYTIAAGGIAVTVALIDKIIPIASSRLPGLLYFGWLSLVLTIMVNLISHRVSHNSHYKTIQEINRGDYDEDAANHRNKIIGRWNDFTIALLIIGVTLIMSFITYNLIHMSQEKPVVVQQPTPETKGLQSTAPVSTKPKK